MLDDLRPFMGVSISTSDGDQLILCHTYNEAMLGDFYIIINPISGMSHSAMFATTGGVNVGHLYASLEVAANKV